MTEQRHHIEREIVHAWNSGDIQTALNLIERVLREGPDEHRGRALLYRGPVREEEDNWLEAMKDFAHAANYIAAGTYARYNAELSAGRASAELGDADEALSWYRAALKTCVYSSESFSGALAVKTLLTSNGGSLTPQDESLAKQAFEKSWSALEISGQPDLANLSSTAEQLLRTASGDRSSI